MAKGEERRKKRREAILDVGVLYEGGKKGRCSDILFWDPTTVFQVPFLGYSVLSVTCGYPGNPV